MVRGTEQSLLASWLTDVADLAESILNRNYFIFFNLNIFSLFTCTRHDKD